MFLDLSWPVITYLTQVHKYVSKMRGNLNDPLVKVRLQQHNPIENANAELLLEKREVFYRQICFVCPCSALSSVSPCIFLFFLSFSLRCCFLSPSPTLFLSISHLLLSVLLFSLISVLHAHFLLFLWIISSLVTWRHSDKSMSVNK